MNKEDPIIKKLAQLARKEVLAGTESYEAFVVHHLYRNGLLGGPLTIDTGSLTHTSNYTATNEGHERVCFWLYTHGIVRRRLDRGIVYYKLSLQFRSMVNFHTLEDEPVEEVKFDYDCVPNRELAVLIRSTLLMDSTDDLELSICHTLYHRAPYPITTVHPGTISTIREALISPGKVIEDIALSKAVTNLMQRGVITMQIYAGREYYYLSLEMMTLMSHIYRD
jgi:hypothetical protein